MTDIPIAKNLAEAYGRLDGHLVEGDDIASALDRMFHGTRTGKAFAALSRGMTLDAKERRDNVFRLAKEVSYLEDAATLLRPLASVCADTGLSKATVDALKRYRDAIERHGEKRTPEDDGSDINAKDVSFQIARCGEREAMKDLLARDIFDEHQQRFRGLMTPINDLPDDSRRLFQNAVSYATGRTVEELQGDTDLLAVHHTPLAGELYEAVTSRMRVVKDKLRSEPDDQARQDESRVLKGMRFELDELRGDHNQNVGQDTGFFLEALI